MFLNKFTESSLPIYAYLICKRLRRGLKNLMYSYYTLKQLFFYKFEDEYCPLLIHCSNHCWFMNRFLWKKSSSAKELIFFKKRDQDLLQIDEKSWNEYTKEFEKLILHPTLPGEFKESSRDKLQSRGRKYVAYNPFLTFHRSLSASYYRLHWIQKSEGWIIIAAATLTQQWPRRSRQPRHCSNDPRS